MKIENQTPRWTRGIEMSASGKLEYSVGLLGSGSGSTVA